MKLADLALPVLIGLGFSALWHASLIMSIAQNPSSAGRNMSLVVAMIVFVSSVAAAMWMVSAIGWMK